eukprot:gene10468-8428_t
MRITVSTTTSSPACIWQLNLLPDGTLVTGDSEGAVQFFDAQFGTLLQRFQRHAADVVAIAAAPDGSAVFASGVDPSVALFSVDPSVALFSPVAASPSQPDDSTWTYLHYKRPHSHDVRAMAVVTLEPGKFILISGGVDSQLIAYPVATFLQFILISGGGDSQLIAYPVATFIQEHPVRLCKAPQMPRCQLSIPSLPSLQAPSLTTNKKSKAANGTAKANMSVGQQPRPTRLLATNNLHCDVWQLARASAGEGQANSHGLPGC